MIHRKRTTEEARTALGRMVDAVWTRNESGAVFSIPADIERDADIVLCDVISERDELLARATAAEEALKGARSAMQTLLSDPEPLGKSDNWDRLREAIAAIDRVLGKGK